MKVAAIQLSAQDRVDENLARVAALVLDAKGQGAELAVLPEGFAFLGRDGERGKVSERLDEGGPIVSSLVRLAREHRITLIGGGMPESASNPARPYNTSVCVGPDGRVLGSYRKMHLFDVALDDGTEFRESASSELGDAPVVVGVGEHQVGLAICYDVRFPRLFERERELGATVLTLPAAFTEKTGEAHWHVLCRARAIEAQCYVVAAAQWGTHPGHRRTFGHSLIVDPWGQIVAELPGGDGVVVGELDLEAVLAVRRQMPVYEHRAPALR